MHGVKSTPPLTALRAPLGIYGKQQPLGAKKMQHEKEREALSWELKTIIDTSNSIASTGEAEGWSTSEQIAAAFMWDRMEFLPAGYSVIEAWERLGDWQGLVKRVRANYRHLLVPW